MPWSICAEPGPQSTPTPSQTTTPALTPETKPAPTLSDAFTQLPDVILNNATAKAPIGELVDIMDIGFACAYLATPYARRITGETLYIDGGANIVV
jgi:enoyl-[acyl-carrier-protein] reductase (NADH)